MTFDNNPERSSGESPEREKLAEQETLAGPLSGDPAEPGEGIAPGTVLAHYRLTDLLGEGGFGQVWRAEHLEDGRVVALKVLTKLQADSTEALERFKREGRIAASINHPNSVYVFGADQLDGYPVISQELMVGGTLADLIDEKGRLEAEEVVDRILEIIEGLEAAHQIGVLHRDIKPSNCFLDENGQAKIGDYGLSKSLVSETDLTKTSSFLGTPVYSSPEQVRGRGVDVRSDIYSLGATLYALLAGKPPFAAGNAGEVLARILSEEPTPFSEHEVKLPRGLDKAVMRCLHKNPDRRFQDYEALRQVLLPYSSEATTAGSVPRRFVANAVDSIVTTALTGVLVFFDASPLSGFSIYSLILTVGYFVICEGRWGHGLGKWLLGIRVALPNGAPAGPARILARTVVFFAVTVGLQYLYALLRGFPMGDSEHATEIGLILPLAFLLLASTMRRRNGFAMLHDVVTDTRVIEMKRRAKVSVPELGLRMATAAAEGRRLGPFAVRGTVWETDEESLLIGYDEGLQRDVWLHTSGSHADPQSIQWLSVNRPGRLRWLQGGSDTGVRWDAFEAPSGTSLSDWLCRSGRLKWAQLRGVLATLTLELQERFAGDEPFPPLTLSHVWVDDGGQAKILDFPAEAPEPDAEPPMEVDAGNWKDFIRHVVVHGLVGYGGASRSLSVPPAIPLPQHAREFLSEHPGEDAAAATLASPSNREQTGGTEPASAGDRGKDAGDIDTFVEELQRIQTLPATISLGCRAAMFAAMLGPYVVIVASFIIFALTVEFLMADMNAIAFYESRLNRVETELEEPGLLPEERQRLEQRREAYRRVIAFHWRDARQSSLISQNSFPLEAEDLAVPEAALADYPDVTQEQIEQDIELFELRTPRPRPSLLVQLQGLLITVIGQPAIMYLAVVAVFSLVFAFALRGGLLFTLFGFTLQRSDGRLASRATCLRRAAVAWSPVLAGAFVVAVISSVFVIPMFFLALAGAGMIRALRNPEQGIPDEIVGTHFVAK